MFQAVKIVTPADLPTDMKRCVDSWLEDFRQSITHVVPFEFAGEDETVRGFRSTEAFKEWFGQPPGVPGQPYCDERFYIRELMWLSKWCNPETVVEFGTDVGVGTCLLAWLNPQAVIHTVDIASTVKMPTEIPTVGEVSVAVGHLSKYQALKNVRYYQADSRLFRCEGADLCFIDASHLEDDVLQDSRRAWKNRNQRRRWIIIWHDYVYEDSMYGLRKAIGDFANEVQHTVYKFADSGTVWMYGEPG